MEGTWTWRSGTSGYLTDGVNQSIVISFDVLLGQPRLSITCLYMILLPLVGLSEA